MTRIAFLSGLLLATSAAAVPTIEVTPSKVRPGDPLVVKVTGFAQEPTLTVGEHVLKAWRDGDAWRAIAGLPVEQAPGSVAVRAVRDTTDVAIEITVEKPEWRTRELSVAPKFTEPTPAMKRKLDADRKAFEKVWARPFGPPLFTAPFALPREATVTAPFGDRRTFNGNTESQHYGTDYDGRVGAPIRASNDGLVAMVRDNVAAGKTVVVAHGAGVFTTYFHLSKSLVKLGQRVKRGQLIGKVGKSGRVTGPHLHFGARVNGFYVDAESLLKLPIEWKKTPAAAPKKKAAAKKAPAKAPAR